MSNFLFEVQRTRSTLKGDIWVHNLGILLEQLRVDSFQLQVETDHQFTNQRYQKTQTMPLTREQVRGTSQFHMSYLSIHYFIKGRFYWLQRDSGGSLSTFFHCLEQRCLPLFMREICIDHNPCMDLPSHIPSGGLPLFSMLTVHSMKQAAYIGPYHYRFQISET